MESIRGFKCFKSDGQGRLKCLQQVFEVGQTYEVSGEIVLCVKGFHFHEHGGDLFNYYANEMGTRVCEVIGHDVLTDGDKSVCRKIEVVRELSYSEICIVYGSGYGSGSGSGSGYGYGSGSGYGYGDGDGDGYGSGYGSGYGDGDGDGSGYGSGDGSGYGDGDGDGSGYGSGYGYGDSDGYGSKHFLKFTAQGKIAA